jgi:hypothetical protein
VPGTLSCSHANCFSLAMQAPGLNFFTTPVRLSALRDALCRTGLETSLITWHPCDESSSLAITV